MTSLASRIFPTLDMMLVVSELKLKLVFSALALALVGFAWYFLEADSL